MPFGGWEAAPSPSPSPSPVPAAGEARFRFPAPDDPAPSTARLLLMSLYAAVLGLTGLGVGFWAMITVIGGAAFWYVPVLAFFGLLSVGLAVAAFLSIHRLALPRWLLAAAAVPLLVDVLVVALY